jgi:exopolyphosphatase/guanosine-5'-triphosphate,3'-diphosphate pyrophosphatase
MKAAIDIGTNTVLLLVADIENGKLKVIHEEQRMPRLGKGVDAEKMLAPESMDRVLRCLSEYRSILDDQFPDVTDVIVTATSAVRDALNRQEFIESVKNETGFDIKLLSGKEEADYTYSGALAVFDEEETGDVFVLDIGGGSTEVALGRNGKLIDSYSFDMGCVRFNERFLHQDPPFQEQIQQCRVAVKNMLDTKKFKPKRKVKAVGVAGTLTSLAAIDLQIDEYDPEHMNAHIIVNEKLKKGIEIFSLHTHKQLLELSPKVLKGREDIFLAGLLILEGFLNYFDLEEIKVSTGGIRHGALIHN